MRDPESGHEHTVGGEYREVERPERLVYTWAWEVPGTPVVEHDPGSGLAMRSVRAPFPMRVTYEFEDVDGGTRIRIRTSGETGRFYRIAGPLLDRSVRRGVARDLRAVKARLESTR